MTIYKKHKCPICERNYVSENKEDHGKFALYDHMETKHKKDLMGLPASQIYFNFRNKYNLTRGFGKSVISGKPTKFNTVSERYERFRPEERDKYREMFKTRMKKVYGKEHLLDEPEHQKKMLAGRSISGEYVYSDGTKFTYTGSYEKAFLEYLDDINWPSSDIMAPAPMPFTWTNSKKETIFYIPDFYLTSCNLIVEIKSDFTDVRRAEIYSKEDEILQDAAIKKSNFNYIKIYNKKMDNFMNIIEDLNENPNKRIFTELK